MTGRLDLSRRGWTASIILIGAMSLNQAAQAQDGALPRGEKGKTPGRQLQVREQKKATPQGCMGFLASRINRDALFADNEGNTYFVLAKMPPSKGKPMAESHMLIRVDIDAKKGKPLLKVNLKTSPVLIPHGRPEIGFTLLDIPENSGCLKGHGRGEAVPLDGKVIRATYPPAEYLVMETDRGRAVVNLKDLAFRDLDITTMQRRTLAKFKAREMPLYYDHGQRRLVVWDGGNPGSLLRYNLVDNKLESQLKLTNGMRMLQDGGWFGVVAADDAGHWSIQEVQKWSGENHHKFPLSLPPGMVFAESQFDVHFPARRIIAWPAERTMQHKVRKAWIFDYGRKVLKDTFSPAKASQYVAAADLTNDGNRVVFLVKNIGDDTLAGIMIYDLATRRSESVVLDL